MAKYNTYIELSPNFESVVDLDSEERNPNLWQEYIVHEDMKLAVEKICDSLRNEILEARRPFWVHGAYGTGKSYAAIVIKHLFEDPLPNLTPFLSRPLLLEFRNKFTAIREKGEFLVVWKSGCTGIRTGNQLMMEMEIRIRKKLAEKFGKNAYYGRTSLISDAQNLINDPEINWQIIFDNPAYSLSEDYSSFEEFKSEVMNSNLDACKTVADISHDKGWAFFSTVDMFENWLKDIIEGNHLEKTGIVFIWDEFTAFVRECGDDNVLQRLAEYCKQQPFFMFLIVHIESGWVASLGEETYKRILHRYHELEFHISESAAHELIADSIIVRPAMQEQWEEIKDKLIKTIDKDIVDLVPLGLSNERQRLRQLIPIHPMTLSLLAIVSQNFGASQRTLFRFMKDQKEAQQQVGFIYYISTYGPDDWRWLTPDFLWDYFFSRESDVSGGLSQEARRCYQHYQSKKDAVASDVTASHVFKAIMLLLAVMSTERISHFLSQQITRKIQATKLSLYKCFAGQLAHGDIDRYLTAFEDNGWIRLDNLPSGDARLELPYSGSVEVFDVRLDLTKKKNTRYELFKKGGIFSKALEEKMWDPNRATKNRVLIAVSSSETASINTRKNALNEELSKNPYKIGLLFVTISDLNQYSSTQIKLKEMAERDTSGRLIYCVGKEPLTDEKLNRWHQSITHKDLAGEEGLKASASKYEDEASINLEGWAQTAAEGQIISYFRNVQSSFFGRDELIRHVEKDIIFNMFNAAPELIVSVSTAFKRAQESAALAGITQISASAQLNNIANGVKTINAWDVPSISELALLSGSSGARAIAALARLIHEKLSQGAKVKLDELWADLQNPPFGYYDNLASAYLLGFVLRFYKDGAFNWVDSSNNTFPLNDQHLSTMVFKMCRDDVINHTLSSGSEIWQQFKPYIQKIFKLSAEESTNEDQARKYMRAKITASGTPLWVIKYIPESFFGGHDGKTVCCNVTDAFCEFIAGQTDSESSMSTVLTLFKGQGQIRQSLTDAFENLSERHKAFRAYLFEKQPEIKDLVGAIGINPNELLDGIKELMQSEIYTWDMAQVEDKLEILKVDYQLIDILNKALEVKKKSISSLKVDLSNFFSSMKVPGLVIETFNQPWVSALKLLRLVSLDLWKDLKIEEKTNNIILLQEYAKLTWEYLGSSKILLKEYFTRESIEVSDNEVNNIYSGLTPLPYDTPSVVFKESIQRFIDNITYERDKKELLALWKSLSAENSVCDWCKKYKTPIQWVVDDDSLPHVLIIKSINDGMKVDRLQLQRALDFLKGHDNLNLHDQDLIQRKFLSQIGENNVSGFLNHQEEILSRLRVKLGAEIFNWGNKPGELRNEIESVLREKNARKYKDATKEVIMKMPDKELRKKVAKFLEDYPEYCSFFLDLEL